MLPLLDSRYAQLEKKLADAEKWLLTLPPNKVHQAPAEAWSAAQILYHLLLSETGTVNYLVKKLNTPPAEVEKAGLFARIRGLLLRRALRNYEKKYRAPSIAADIPERPDLHTTLEAYHQNRIRLRELLARFDRNMTSRAYFKHPRAGRISIMDTLNFMEDHFDRHLEQMKERSR